MSKVVEIIDPEKAKQALEKSPEIVQKHVKLLEDRYKLHRQKMQKAVKVLKELNEILKIN